MDSIDKLYENHIQEFLKKLKVSDNPEISCLSPPPLWYVISYAIAVVTRGGRTGTPDHYAHNTFLNQRNLLMPLIVLQVLSIEQVVKGKRLSLHTSQVPHQARVYPGFCSMKQI